MLRLEITSKATGPLVDGVGPKVMHDMLDEIVRVIATKAFSEVHQLLDASIRNPTPYYETQIVNDRVGRDRVIHDRGIIYGPWLEGTGSRNRTTRFKGYASFRRARQAIEARVPELAGDVVRRYLPKMGGR